MSTVLVHQSARKVNSLFHFAAQSVKDSAARYRMLWFGVGFIMSGTLFAVGAGYALLGNKATSQPELFKYIAILPGGLHTHGFILVILAFINFWGLAVLTQTYTKLAYTVARTAAILITFYTLLVSFGFVGAILVGGVRYSAGTWWYVMVALLSLIKVALPPPMHNQLNWANSNPITGG